MMKRVARRRYASVQYPVPSWRLWICPRPGQRRESRNASIGILVGSAGSFTAAFVAIFVSLSRFGPRESLPRVQ